MRVETLINSLPTNVTFEYEGKMRTIFGGVSVNHRSTDLKHRFFALTPRTLRKLPPRDDENWDAAFSRLIRRMRRRGASVSSTTTQSHAG